MAKTWLTLGKWLLRAGLALTVIVLGLSYDPAPCFIRLQHWAYLVAAGSQHLVSDFKVSRPGGEFMLAQNIGGLEASAQGLSLREMLGSTGMVINEPVDMIASHLQPLRNMRVSATAMAGSGAVLTEPKVIDGSGPEDQLEQTDIAVNENYPPIAIYCTHNAETYVPDEQKTHSTGERGLINDVGLALATSLTQQGFRAVFVDTVHDSPDYSQSYVKSRETVKQLLQEDDSWGVIIDVHRDSIPEQKMPAVVDIKGRKAAQMLIIIGSDQRKPNPEWSKNLDFAQQLFRESQATYPGLIRGVRVKPGTYNQDLYSPAILLEVGNEYNSLEQASYGAEIFAEVLARVLLEGSQG